MSNETLRQHLRDWLDDRNPLPSWPLVWRRDAERLELESFQRGREYERDHQHA